LHNLMKIPLDRSPRCLSKLHNIMPIRCL
jgi:hypothetical protein